MADTASLVVRVRGDGIKSTASELERMSATANAASSSAAKLGVASAKAGKSTGKIGNTAQQAGYQLQDMIVQLQMGTSAFTAIGQQVPQFLGAFGPIGAITGAVVALGSAAGGILYKSMSNATVSSKKLEMANKSLGSVLRDNDDDVQVLSNSILKLARVSEQAAKAKIAAAMADAQTQIKGAQKAAEDAAQSVDAFFSSINASGSLSNAVRELESYRKSGRTTEDAINALSNSTTAAYSNLGATANFVERLGDKLGLTATDAIALTDAMGKIEKAKTPEALKAAADKAFELSEKNKFANDELTKMSANLQKAFFDMQRGKEASDALKGALKNLGKASADAGAEVRKSAAEQIESLRLQTLEGEAQILAQAALKKKQIENDKALNDSERARAKAYVDQISAIQIDSIKERAAATAKIKEEIAANEARREKRTSGIEARRVEAKRLSATAYIEQLKRDNLTELELVGYHEEDKAAEIKKLKDLGLISEQAYQTALTDITTTGATERTDIILEQMERESKKKKEIQDREAEAKAKLEADKMQQIEDGIRGQSDMTSHLKAALGEQNALYKASAIITATIDTYKAATGAYAAMSSIPVVGPALGALAAGAAIAAGVKQIQMIRSAREQGGNMVGGVPHQMLERGKAEIVVPAGASRARTLDQVRGMVGEGKGSSGGTPDITIINNTTGRIDNASAEMDNEGRLRILISEQVSEELMTQDSPIAKARKYSSGQAGF